MNLSQEGQRLAEVLVKVLREEYRDGFRDRRALDRLLARWRTEVERLSGPESRALLTAVRPLLRGYRDLSPGDRQHHLVSSGQELGRLLGREPRAAASPSRRPPGGDARLRLDSSVQYLKGVGPRMAGLLAKLGISTVEDLVLHLPRRWEDRSQSRPISSLRDGALETVRGVLGRATKKMPRKGLTLIQVPLQDQTGTLMLTWFNQPYLLKQLLPGKEAVVSGKVERKFSEVQMSSPEIELGDDQGIHTGRIIPVYPLTGRVSQKWLRTLQFKVVPTYAPLLPENLTDDLLSRTGFPGRGEAVAEFHWPSSFDHRERARRRLAFEELFMLQLKIAIGRQSQQQEPRTAHYLPDRIRPLDFTQLLPFTPTGAQKRVMAEIVEDLARPSPMNRLLQGDVGAGKTVVAAYAAWSAIRCGYQAAIMAPTEILAEQHFQKLSDLLEPTGIRVGRLSGSMRKKAKREVCQALVDQQLDLVVGTHALIQEGVEFANLGMVVVDEQHKFGVMQRTTLRQKGANPDLLVMTATPIPRTLALTLYGDLEVSRLDELPPGRRPIHSESVPFSERKRVYEEIRREIKAGRQAYIICPLVEETEKVDATAAVEEAEIVQKRVFPEFSVGLLHGKMKAADKEAVMEAFRQGQHQILISTTVIEVGVDVPNATVMLVQDANRFGLAQLHQLRGRVGRGSHASRCIFMGDTRSPDSQRRLAAIARMSDGFDVAEEDLQIRGPGDFYGLRQSGFPEFRVADLLRDQALLEEARREARRLLDSDPDLERHPQVRAALDLLALKTGELVH